MKIDFHGRFQEVSRLIQLPRGDAGAVGPSLSDLLPKPPVEAQQQPEFDIEQILDEQERGPMARMEFPAALPKGPGLPEIEIELQNPSPVEPRQGSVKTPTPIDARRIESAHELAALPRARRIAVVEELVQDAGTRHGVDPALSLAVVAAESSFDPLAVSQDGHESKGLFQLLDSTGKDRLRRHYQEVAYNPFEPAQNVDLGVGYLRHLHQLFSEETELPNKISTVPAANSSSLEKLAVAAFNAGEGRVASAQARAARAGKNPAEYEVVAAYLPESTQEYVQRVMQLKTQFEERSIG